MIEIIGNLENGFKVGLFHSAFSTVDKRMVEEIVRLKPLKRFSMERVLINLFKVRFEFES